MALSSSVATALANEPKLRSEPVSEPRAEKEPRARHRKRAAPGGDGVAEVAVGAEGGGRAGRAASRDEPPTQDATALDHVGVVREHEVAPRREQAGAQKETWLRIGWRSTGRCRSGTTYRPT